MVEVLNFAVFYNVNTELYKLLNILAKCSWISCDLILL